jgi:opacity protein-like surface antigen
MARTFVMVIVFGAALLAASTARAADPAQSGIEIGLRTGYAFAAGNRGATPTQTDEAVGNYVAGQVPLWLDIGYRLNSDLYLGGFFQYGFGIVNDDRQDPCRLDNVDCSASDTRLGVMARYHLPVGSPLSPWLGLGIGYEWATFSANQSLIGSSNTDATWSGFEFANVQVGADYHLAPKVALAPFVSVSFGQFRHASRETTIGTTTTTMDEDVTQTSVHEWILFGVRAAFMP